MVCASEENKPSSTPHQVIPMTTFIAQKALTGFAAFALAAAGTALPGTEANAAPLIFDCYSRSTSDLLMKSALDLSNENLACLQNGTAQVSYQPVAPQTVYVQPAPAPAPAPSTGESFFGSVLGGAIGGVIGNAINGGNRTEHHHYHDNNKQGQGSGKESPKPQPSGKGGTATIQPPIWIKPGNLGAGMVTADALKKQRDAVLDAGVRLGYVQQKEEAKKNLCRLNPFLPSCRGQ